jgi:hypothetical protein
VRIELKVRILVLRGNVGISDAHGAGLFKVVKKRRP